MASVRLFIHAELCGPVSLGTVAVIRAVQKHAGVTLSEATALVDRCVFDGETVTIEGLSPASASALVEELRTLRHAPPIEASIEE